MLSVTSWSTTVSPRRCASVTSSSRSMSPSRTMRDAVACFIPPVPREKMSRYAARWAFGSCIEPKAHRAAYRLIFSRGTGGMKQATASRIVLEGLIERELLVTEAQRLGLTVVDQEVTDNIFAGYVLLS